MPAARHQFAEQAAHRRGLVEMKGLRIEFRRESFDLFGRHLERPGAKALVDEEILEIERLGHGRSPRRCAARSSPPSPRPECARAPARRARSRPANERRWRAAGAPRPALRRHGPSRRRDRRAAKARLPPAPGRAMSPADRCRAAPRRRPWRATSAPGRSNRRRASSCRPRDRARRSGSPRQATKSATRASRGVRCGR